MGRMTFLPPEQWGESSMARMIYAQKLANAYLSRVDAIRTLRDMWAREIVFLVPRGRGPSWSKRVRAFRRSLKRHWRGR